MIAVCITGSYASGKSFVLEYLKNKGYKVFSADDVVKFLYEDISIREKILKVLPTLKEFDIGKIASLIYSNIDCRKKLENVVHPLVLKELKRFFKNSINEKIIFAEVPLVFEKKLEKYFDFIVVCYCTEKCRLHRASLKPSFNKKIFKKIEEIQFSQKEKIKRADFVINTEKESTKLKSDIDNLVKKILQ